MPRAVVESMVLAGNVERCAAQLARALDPRVSSVTVRPHAVAGGSVQDVVQQFAEEVFPRALELRETLTDLAVTQTYSTN